jgi:FkbM family methyltransferase
MAELLIDLKAIEFNPPVRGVVHAGAHRAEEYDTYTALGANRVVYIEANPHLVKELKSKFKGNDGVSVIQAAISDGEYDAEFIIHNDTHTSSLLEMKVIAETHPELEVNERIKIKTKSLNQLFVDEEIDLTHYNILTIDVQGVELQALKGCNLTPFDYIYIEVETWELYEGGKNYEEIKEYLKDWEIIAEHLRPWGWGDVLFKRK